MLLRRKNMSKLNTNKWGPRGLISVGVGSRVTHCWVPQLMIISCCSICCVLLMVGVPVVHSAPSLAAKSWPVMKNYDIWGTSSDAAGQSPTDADAVESSRSHSSGPLDANLQNGTELVGGWLRSGGRTFGLDHFGGHRAKNELFQVEEAADGQYLLDDEGDGGRRRKRPPGGRGRGRSAKVLNFLPVPVDDECLSDDGLRTGQCMNVYECRIQGGSARGQCALGFGVCCIFTATCDQEMANNITYFVSPGFPALLPKDMSSCKLKIKLMNTEISQLKFDFIHFALGQPNRRTGICDGDVFKLIGGVLPFDLCGLNSGQHLYYDLTPQARANEDIEMEMVFSPRSFTQRLWEIKVTQIPFSQRAPSGCMQYFTGSSGVFQTFNFAENGRHLANHNYRACFRQEKGMCSVAYEPCDDQSFRIGNPIGNGAMIGGSPGSVPGTGAGGVPGAPGAGVGTLGPGGVPVAGTVPGVPGGATGTFSDPSLAADPLAPAADVPVADVVPPPADAEADDGPGIFDSPADEPAADEPAADEPAADEPAADDPEAEEGSGGGDGGGFFSSFFPSFFSRSFHGYSHRQARYSRQLFTSSCTDRITLPCIVEDFIGVGMGDLPRCLPVHCGNSLCPAGVSPCRIETTVTPFALGIHFGEGLDKGSPEDNIGACLRYSQIPCAG
ncbi:uncharacterized protein LOC129747669 [Uranotaenia lowii]|uniref:uncharacterized protein LOC129747669 n=1 Tax=Uranotaenia lowii TaxID=190385 RepID=UPI0024792771|nr:uncharacterized protein LOC129747669 [Uranotaenia lowii]XP_055597950.1 uncharacterized protein LOC129747669 [Uranotaenia lowii]XP_055597951.1 uncharacterized protein LOC129747669 [Uranotaenia lowii]